MSLSLLCLLITVFVFYRMDTSLVELESDISRLAIQHEKIQRQFFLHGDPPNDSARSRKKVPSGPSMPPSSGRSQWGAPKPFDSSSSDESTPRGSAGGGGGGVYNGDSNRGRPTPRSGSNSINYASPSFRLHSNSETQGNRLFSNTRYSIKFKLLITYFSILATSHNVRKILYSTHTVS